VVTEDTAAAEALQAVAQSGEDWALVTDAERKPLGWASARELESLPAGARAGDAQLQPYGHTFSVSTDSLRAALDATVLSPTGHAVGADEAGRVVGITSYERLRAAIQAADAPRQDRAKETAAR